jgi:hypothetical protein
MSTRSIRQHEWTCDRCGDIDTTNDRLIEGEIGCRSNSYEKTVPKDWSTKKINGTLCKRCSLQFDQWMYERRGKE